MTLEGKRIVVTAGSGGLGRVVVTDLLARGASVHLTYRTPEELERASAHWAGGPEPVVHAIDLTDANAAIALAGDLQAGGPIHGLVCCTGTWMGGHPLWETDPGIVHKVLSANFVATFTALRAFTPGMVAAGEGRIVTVGSRVAFKMRKGSSLAAASKAAVTTLTEVLAEELVGTGVAAYCIAPSSIATDDMIANMRDADQSRWVAPERVAAVIAWLLGPDAGVANGAVIPVYGDA
ncbi:MAG: SDR family NAD(P)-dependent oxidoreductase [Coriobacteriia bacterium]